MAEEIVRFEDVDKSFGDTEVLTQFNFSARRGEKVTIMGPSGSGKTTILRLLMTLEPVTGGKIWVDGDYLTHMEKDGELVPANEKHVRKVRRKIGMVFQHFNLFPHMKVLRNVTEAPIHVLKLDKEEADERAKRVLDMVGLSGKLEAYPSELSGGQKQRVAIARALAMQPKVMCFDEVTSALDPELIGEVLDVLEVLATETDMTMLLVTHEVSFARDVSDRVIMFDQGNVVEESPPEKFFTNPESERTRKFLKAVLEPHEMEEKTRGEAAEL